MNILGDDVLFQWKLAGGTHAFAYDGQGTTRQLIGSGGVNQAFYSDSYGVERAAGVGTAPANAATSFLYTGEVRDPTTGWTYLRARYLDNTNGTFNREDPFFGNLDDPQSLHKYAYVHGDPVNSWDPTGLASFTLGSLKIQFSIQAYIIGILISYAIGKVISAGISIAFTGSLQNFKWLEWSDLLNLIPGGVFALLFGKVVRIPVQAFSKVAPSSAKGATGYAGKLFVSAAGNASNGAQAAANLFQKAFPAGLVVRSLSGMRYTLSAGGKRSGLSHILQEHTFLYWNGKAPPDALMNSFFPSHYVADDVIRDISEAMSKQTNVWPIANKEYIETVSSGLDIGMVFDAAGNLITAYPARNSNSVLLQDIVDVLL